MKKTVALVISIVLIMSLIAAGCSAKPASPVDTTSSANTEVQKAPEIKKEVKMLTNVTGGKDEEEMKLFQEKLSEATGLTITMEKPASDYGKVMMQKLQSGEKFDLIYFNQKDAPELVNQGVLTDLTDLIKASPVLSDTSIIPASEWDLLKINGKIYTGFNKREVHKLVNVNGVIAEKAGVDVTKIEPTLDGYYEAMKKMKAYNDSTIKDKDFYAFNACLIKMHDFQPWFAAAGLKGGIVLDQNGKKTVPWASDEAALVWDWFHKLYTEGLMDKNIFIDETKDMRNKFQSGKTGVTVDWAAWTGLYNMNAAAKYPNEFKAVPLPGIKTPSGSYMLARGDASVWGVPANAENVAGAMKVLEFFATQEGGELLSVGIAGHDYNIENGKYVLTEIGKKHSSDHGAPVPANVQFKHPVGWNPGFEDAMKYIEFASPEATFVETNKYLEIVAKHGAKIIMGEVSTKDGLAAMRDELKIAGAIE